MNKPLVSCLSSLVLAAVVGATALTTFGSARPIDLSSSFVSTNYLDCIAQRTEKPMFKGGVISATSGQTFDLTDAERDGIWGAEQTSGTHWSIVYNLSDLTAQIATLGNCDEIFPYRLELDAPDDWTTEAPKSARPSVETNLPPFEAATAEPGMVYRLADPISGSSGAPSSYAGASVAAVNRLGLTYDAPDETLHAVATNGATAKCRAVYYVDMSSRDPGKAACSIVAGVSEKGLAGRVVKFKNSTGPGEHSPSKTLMSVLNSSETFEAALKMMEAVKQSEGGCGFVLSDAMGNVAVWGPEGAELEPDDASEMVRNSLDLRKGIYETDGDGLGQFDELPGLMRLASTADTKAIVSMGYGHLDVMLPNSNVLWRAELEGVTIPAYGVVAGPSVVAHATATLTYTNGNVVATNNQGRLVAETNVLLRVAYAADSGYCFADGARLWTRDFSVGATVTTPPAPEAEPSYYRAPDYALASGKDWLFNHAIAGKGCPDEAAADSGVDLFFVYPTLAGGEQIVIGGFRGIDDATMRSAATNYATAVGAYCESGRCFADMTCVYAPFYRQATLDTAYDCATNAAGEVTAEANANYLTRLCEGPAYADVTNALTTYFAKWNKDRKLVLAAHSQGSALLRLVMENYFTLPENRDKAKRIVCSYQIGFGIGQFSVDSISLATGVTFAEKADDTNVIVSYNTMSAATTGNSILLPSDTIAINPITWTRGADLADKDLNLGARTNGIGKPDVIEPHLYSAQVVDTGANRGQVVVCAELKGHELAESLFGEGSLHGNDYSAYWENLRANCFARIASASGLREIVTNGLPTVADATVEVKVDGLAAVVNPLDGTPYATVDAKDVKLVYTLDEAKAAEGYYFPNGTTVTSVAMKYDSGVWSATAAEIAAVTKTGEPKLQLGVVAQRYPWNGIVDVGYRATFWPAGKAAAVEVTVGESVTTNAINIVGQGMVVGTAAIAMPAETKGKATFRVVEK